VVASLWRQDDQACAVLMSFFYQFLGKEKLSPTEALRRAQQALREQPQWRAPYYWAGWVFQGDWLWAEAK
jgi:CHAT domain-containing protein